MSDAEKRIPWELFDSSGEPQIQLVDEEGPEGASDDDAAIAFVSALERGDPKALTAAEVFLDFYRDVKHEPGVWDG